MKRKNKAIQPSVQAWARQLPDNPEHPESWKRFAQLKKQVEAYVQNYRFNPKTLGRFLDIIDRYMNYLILTAQYKTALNWLGMMERCIPERPGNHGSRALLTAYKAEVFRMQGRNREAENLIRPVLAQLEVLYPVHQLELARLYTILGLVLLYDDNLRYEASGDYLHRALLVRQLSLGNENLQVCASRLHMAEYYIQLRNIPRARSLVEPLQTNPDLMANPYYYAWIHDMLGLIAYYESNYALGIQHCEKGLIARRRFLGKHHPLMLESLHNVGFILHNRKRYGEAIEYLKQTYGAIQKVYTPGHQNYLVTVGAFAQCNLNLGQPLVAAEALDRALATLLHYPRQSYNYFSVAVENLYYHYERNTCLDKQVDLLNKYLGLLKNRKFPYDDRYRITLEMQLKLLKASCRCKETADVKKELAEVRCHELMNLEKSGKASPTLWNNAGVYFKNALNDYRRAEEYYLKAIEQDPGMANAYGNYAFLLFTVHHEDDKAEPLFIKSLELDPNNEAVVGNYAFFLQNARKKYAEAELIYEEALRLKRNEPCNLANFASFKLTRGDIESAKRMASQSLNICIPQPNRHMARPLLLLIIIRMFECMDYSDLTGKMKSLVQYGIDHVPWDNRELLVFARKILNEKEYGFVEMLLYALNDITCMERLEQSKEWIHAKPLPFITTCNDSMD